MYKSSGASRYWLLGYDKFVAGFAYVNIRHGTFCWGGVPVAASSSSSSSSSYLI